MTSPVVCAPLWVEERALLGALPAESVLRTGMGPRRSRQSRETAAWSAASAVAVTGIAGGLDPGLRPGDVVVANEVHTTDGTVAQRLPAARLVAADLRRAGIDAVVGPVVSADHVVGGVAERKRLARTGAVAVDMESAWLLDDTRPGLVVRVVADVAGRPLVTPATLGRMRTSLRTLTTVAATLRRWEAAVGSREVLLAEPRSFCAGVERAVEVVDRALDRRPGPVYVRKQIVHNRYVVHRLRERGAVFVDELSEVPAGATVVFSAHGVSPAVRDEARRRKLDVIDATCPLVTKVHAEVRRFGDRGDTVLFIGHAGHEETEGTMGERPERTLLVETVEDALAVQVPDPARVSFLVQTTLSVHEVDEIVTTLRERFPLLRGPATDDICYATTNRQEALQAVATESDLVLVVGSANSSNSRRLVETAERFGTPARLVDDVDDVDLDWLAGTGTIGITAGASAPQLLVDEVVDALSGLGPTHTTTRQVRVENVSFTLPKEVRTA
jgi:4-hydroxy-3-methylbut-2-en-1-yl diphosphate reductase